MCVLGLQKAWLTGALDPERYSFSIPDIALRGNFGWKRGAFGWKRVFKGVQAQHHPKSMGDWD